MRGLSPVSEEVIYPHVFGNADREVGGVLVGTEPADGGLPNVTGAIPAISADEQRATLTFTQDSWEHVHRVLESEYSGDERIVGWYHSHPGFGIFLSSHDLFIHHNFFSAPSQIAVVVDPIGCTDGVFVWRNGEVVKMYELPTPEGWSADVNARPPGADPDRLDESSVRHGSSISTAILAAIVGVLVVIVALTFVASDNDSEVRSDPDKGQQAAPASVVTLTPDQVRSELENGVDEFERRGLSAVAAFRYTKWPKSTPTVVVGRLASAALPVDGIADYPDDTWTANEAIVYAEADQRGSDDVDANDPFVDWRTRGWVSTTVRSNSGPRFATQIRGVPDQFVYFMAYAEREPGSGKAFPAPSLAANEMLLPLAREMKRGVPHGERRTDSRPESTGPSGNSTTVLK